MKNKNLNKKLVEKIMSAKHCSKQDAESWLKSVMMNNAELSRISGGNVELRYGIDADERAGRIAQVTPLDDPKRIT